MPLKVKEIIITQEIKDILDEHFGGQIALIKGSKLTKLFDEGHITNKMFTYLKKVKQTYNKSEKGELKLKLIYKLDKDEPDKDKDEPKNEPEKQPKKLLPQSAMEFIKNKDNNKVSSKEFSVKDETKTDENTEIINQTVDLPSEDDKTKGSKASTEKNKTSDSDTTD